MDKVFTYSLMSDLHINHPQPRIPYDMLEESVIVAGDTSNGLEGLKFLQKLRNKGFNVYATDGNHEHYRNTSQGRTLKETEDRFTLDYPRRIDIDDILTILLTNGWYPVTNPNIWFNCMNDGRYAVGEASTDSAFAVAKAGIDNCEFIRRSLLAEPDRKFIVVTHTAPCLETLDPRFEGYHSNEWYWNPLMREVMEEFSHQILVWNHGHTHTKNEAVVEGVRVVCNPRGYPGENPDWKPLSIEVRY